MKSIKSMIKIFLRTSIALAIIFLSVAWADEYLENSSRNELGYIKAGSSLPHRIVLAADYWCPYNCNAEDENQGFLVELIQRALYPYGIEVSYKVMPWFRALEQVKTGEIDGIIGISDYKTHKLVTTNVPLEYSISSSFTRSGINWVYDGISSLRGKKLGIIVDYILSDEIQNYFMTNFAINQNLFVIEDGKLAVVESVANLIDGDSDIFIEDERVVTHYLQENGLESYVRNAGQVGKKSMPVYVAFNPKIENIYKLIRIIENGIASMRATGEYRFLHEKYKMGQLSEHQKNF